MGLTLHTADGESFSVGSYSTVHALRAAATALKLHQIHDAETIEELCSWIGAEVDDFDPAALDLIDRMRAAARAAALDESTRGPEIAYDMLPEDNPWPHDAALTGLYKLVRHSDCDGSHSPGDVHDVAALLDGLDLRADWLPIALRERLEQLRCFFQIARRRNSHVAYC